MMIYSQRTDKMVTTDWSSFGWGAVLHPTPHLRDPPILSVQFPTAWRTMWSGHHQREVMMKEYSKTCNVHS